MRITCPRCDTNVRAPDDPIDRPLRCPVCEKVLLRPPEGESEYAVRPAVVPAQPLEGPARVTSVLMLLLLLTGTATTVAGVRVLIASRQPGVPGVRFGADVQMQIVSGLLGLATLGAFVAMLVWKHRAYNNLLGRCSVLRSTPQGAVGWYFCPIMSLWKPYEAMKDIWCNSPHDCAADVSILRGWWAALVGGMLALMFGDLVQPGASPGEPGAALILRTLAGGMLAIWALATIMVVSAVTRWQRRWIDGDRCSDSTSAAETHARRSSAV